jgi:hypothetical protein
VKKDGVDRRVCLRWDEGPDAPRYDPVEKLVVVGRAVITVSEVRLSHHRLGEVQYAYGEGKVGNQDALLVATEDGIGGKLTVRIRPMADGEAPDDEPPLVSA